MNQCFKPYFGVTVELVNTLISSEFGLFVLLGLTLFCNSISVIKWRWVNLTRLIASYNILSNRA